MCKETCHFPQKLEKEAERLIKEQPTRQGLIGEKQSEIIENWEELTQRADARKTNLEQSRELQKFLADLRDLVRKTADRVKKTLSLSLHS